MTNGKTNNQESIKRTRVKSYFLEATKEIILEQGPYNVTVRKIAEKSGYSYGSIYNYYKDLDVLMFEVKNLMINDMIEDLSKLPSNEIYTIGDLKYISHMFIDYFMNNKHLYEFFYDYTIKKDGKTAMEDIKFDNSVNTMLKGLVKNNIIQNNEIEAVAKTIGYSLYGMLTLYFSSNDLTKETIHKDLDLIIENTMKDG